MESIQLQANTTLHTEHIHVLHRKVTVSEQVQLSITSGFAAIPHLLDYETPQLSEATIGFNFCVKGAASFCSKGKYTPARADASGINHILFPRTTTTCRLEAAGQFEQITFYVGKQRYFELLGSYAELQPKGFLRAAEVPAYCYFNKKLWTPALRQITAQLMQNQMAGAGAMLYFESKMLETTALLLESYRQKPIEIIKPNRADVEKMQFVREVLEQNLCNPPTLGKLARLAGTNEFALKKNFKEVFGVPVFKYLHQLRMEKAYELFKKSDLLVGEVAMQVGYDSCSAFSRAFKARYGFQPQLAR